MSAQTSGLRGLQQRMQDHVLSGDASALADVREDARLPAVHRLGVYHHAYRARLLETMRDTFGHTYRYLGDEWFDHLALRFIEATPSASLSLRWYGEAWPVWLAAALGSNSAMGSHQEVAELASLDWALRQAFDAADAPVLTLRDLAAMAPEDWATVVLRPQPSMAMLSLGHNTLSLWHALDQDEAVPPAASLAVPMAVLVWRRDEQPHFRSVSAPEALALRALLGGQPFGALCEALAQDFEALDAAAVAGGFLRQWVDDGVLARAA
jgi:hypothetical protein